MRLFVNKELEAQVSKQNGIITNMSNMISSLRYGLGQMIGLSHNGKRNTYDIYGYPESLSGESGFLRMYQLSKRMGIAKRITWGIPKSCWRDGFKLYESDEDDAKELDIQELDKLLKTDLIRKIERADVLNRIGKFSCLYIGIPSDDPMTPIWESKGRDISKLFFRPFAYDGIQISGTVQDTTNERFGLPEYYQVQQMYRGDVEKDTTARSMKVHWSRIIHMCEGALDSDIEGSGALEAVFNRLLDFDKTVGGSAEAYFRNARRIITQEVDPNFATALQSSEEAMKAFQEKTEAFTNEQKDYLVSSGSKIGQLQVQHASPLDTAKVILWEVAGETGIRMRILTGEGAGQLAGSEDQVSYNAIIADRQAHDCTYWLQDLFTKLSMAKLIELPETYDIRFPVQEAVTEMQQTDVNFKKSQTIKNVVDSANTPSGDSIDVVKTLKSLDIEVTEEGIE